MTSRALLAALFGLTILVLAVGCGQPKEPAKPSSLEFEHHTRQKGLPEEAITSLASFGGKIWAGSKSGLFGYDGVNGQIHQKKNTNVLCSDIIEDLKVADNVLWIATDNGACRYNGSGWASVYTSGRARSVIGRGSEQAVATAYGVVYSNGGQVKTLGRESSGLVMDEVNQVVFDHKGQLWAGTRAGIGKLSSEVFQNFTGPAKSVMGSSLIDIPASPINCGLSGNNIKVMMPFGDMMAVGTTSGLTITDLNSYTSYSSQHFDWFQRGGQIVEEMVPGNSPLPGNVINALACSDAGKMLFIGTNKGLAILHGSKWLDLKELVPGFSVFSVNGLAYHKGDLWVGTNEGIYQIKKLSALLEKPKATD